MNFITLIRILCFTIQSIFFNLIRFFLFALIFSVLFSCEKKKELENTSLINVKQVVKQNQDTFFDNEMIAQKLSQKEEIEGFINRIFNDDSVDAQYKVELATSLINSKYWSLISDQFYDDIYIYLGQNYLKLNQNRAAISSFEKALEKYLPQLQADPQTFLLCYLDLATAYSNIQKYDLVIDYTEKGIKIAQKYPQDVKITDYLIAYNNLLYYTTNENVESVFLDFKQTKENYFDVSQKLTLAEQDFKEIIFKKYEIKFLLAKMDTIEAFKKFQEFKSFQPKLKQKINQKNEYYLTTFSFLIDKYFYELKQFNKSLELAQLYYEESKYYPEFTHYEMIALSRIAVSLNALEQFEHSNHYLDILEAKVQPKPNGTSYYSLKIIRAKNLSQMQKHEEVIQILDELFPMLTKNLMDQKVAISDLKNLDYSTFNSDYVINIFSTASNLYLKAYESNSQKDFLAKGESLALAAKKMFGYFYANGSYDDNIANLAQNISESFLYLLTTNYQNNKQKQIEMIEHIEKIASQQLFNQFQQQLLLNNPTLKNSYIKKSKLLSSYEAIDEKLLFESSGILKNEKKQIEKELQLLNSQLKDELKNFVNINEDFSIENILNAIKPNETLVKFYVTKENVYRLVLDNQIIQAEKIGTNKEIEKKVKNYLKALKNPLQNCKNQAKEMFQLFCHSLTNEKISIIPQYYMNYLPFETLIDSDNAYWVSDKKIHYNFSIPLWYAGRIYNFKSSSSQTLCMAANYSDSKMGTKPLRYSLVEIEKIAAITKGKQNKDATKKVFIENAKHFNVYHLAMHANLNDTNFEQSNLLFSQDEPLYFKDFYNLSLPLDMVVLSACNTGIGSIVNGEGIMSLSRALTFSGVKSSVVSYWQVPDKETSEIMIAFYENLKEGQSKDEALANAKRDFIQNNPMKNHPFYWAGFVVNGDISPIQENTNGWLYVGIALTMGLLIFLFRKKLF